VASSHWLLVADEVPRGDAEMLEDWFCSAIIVSFALSF